MPHWPRHLYDCTQLTRTNGLGRRRLATRIRTQASVVRPQQTNSDRLRKTLCCPSRIQTPCPGAPARKNPAPFSSPPPCARARLQRNQQQMAQWAAAARSSSARGTTRLYLVRGAVRSAVKRPGGILSDLARPPRSALTRCIPPRSGPRALLARNLALPPLDTPTPGSTPGNPTAPQPRLARPCSPGRSPVTLLRNPGGTQDRPRSSARRSNGRETGCLATGGPPIFIQVRDPEQASFWRAPPCNSPRLAGHRPELRLAAALRKLFDRAALHRHGGRLAPPMASTARSSGGRSPGRNEVKPYPAPRAKSATPIAAASSGNLVSLRPTVADTEALAGSFPPSENARRGHAPLAWPRRYRINLRWPRRAWSEIAEHHTACCTVGSSRVGSPSRERGVGQRRRGGPRRTSAVSDASFCCSVCRAQARDDGP